MLAMGLSTHEPGAQDTRSPEVIRLPQQTDRAPSAPPSAATPVTRSRTALNAQEVLAELWFRRKVSLEHNDLAAARRVVEQMREVLRRETTLGAESVAGAFVAEGNRALEERNGARALESFHLASEFAPDEPSAYFGSARTLWSQEGDWGSALSAFFQGVRATFRNPGARTARGANILVLLLAGTLGAAVLWSILCALRTARLSQHDFYERWVRSLAPPAAQVAAWATWILPALFWLSGWWLLAYWLAIAQPYLRRSERILSFLACVSFLVATPAMEWITLETAVTTDPAARFLIEAAGGGVDPERIPVLEQMSAGRSSEPFYHFLLAQSYAATGSIEASLQEYRQVQELSAREAKAWINSGNLFFARSQFALAAEEYRRAIQADPKSALAQYNLSLALQGQLRLEEADAAFRAARELDNDLVTTLLASAGSEGEREPVDARYTGQEVLEALQRMGGRAKLQGGWRRWVSPLTLAGIVGLMGCFAAWIAGPGWGFGLAQRCRKCGQPFCRRCQVGMRREEGYCTACRHLYVLKDPVTPGAREARERAVASHQRWEWISRRLVSLLVPGAGQVRGGRTFWGVFLIWVVCTSLAVLLLSGRLLANPGVPVLDSTSWMRVTAVVAIALAWLAANTLAFEKRS